MDQMSVSAMKDMKELSVKWVSPHIYCTFFSGRCSEYFITSLTDLQPCNRSQTLCLNGGVCNNDGNGGYTCNCSLGYEGVQCQTNTDECDSNPCQNGGICTVSKLTSLYCIIQAGSQFASKFLDFT